MSEGTMREVCEEAMKASAAQGMGSVGRMGMGAGGGMAMMGYRAGRSAVGRFFSHPLVLLSLGAAAGYLAYKYREQVAAGAGRAARAGRGFVRRRKESVADIIEEGEEGKGGE
jgi:hypothetical protein